MSTRLRHVILLTLFLAPVFGCSGRSGSRTAELFGTVNYNGRPVTGGSMTLHIGDAVYPIAISPDGKYSANQLPEGEGTVTVDTEFLNPNKPKYGGGSGGGMSPGPSGGQAAGPSGTYVKIPDKYRSKETSDLKATLTKGKQEKNFELKD